MSKDILWIAMRDGKGWASSRTRDMVDLAFTVSKYDKKNGGSLVVIRKPNRDDDPKSRATVVIGMVYYDSVSEAKAAVKAAVDNANMSSSNKESARTTLLEQMLITSNTNANAIIMVGHKVRSQGHYSSTTAVTSVNTTVESTMQEEVEAEIERRLEAAPDAMQQWLDMTKDLTETFNMTKAVADVQAVVEVAFDPSTWQEGQPYPSEYMLVGGRLMKMEWPK
jgi:hypothetical protein